MVWDLLKGLVRRSENSIICLCAIEDIDQVIVLVDEFCELRGVLALVYELYDISILPCK